MADENGTKPGDGETVEVEVGREVLQVIQAVDGSHGDAGTVQLRDKRILFRRQLLVFNGRMHSTVAGELSPGLQHATQLLSKTVTQRCQ